MRPCSVQGLRRSTRAPAGNALARLQALLQQLILKRRGFGHRGTACLVASAAKLVEFALSTFTVRMCARYVCGHRCHDGSPTGTRPVMRAGDVPL